MQLYLFYLKLLQLHNCTYFIPNYSASSTSLFFYLLYLFNFVLRLFSLYSSTLSNTLLFYLFYRFNVSTSSFTYSSIAYWSLFFYSFNLNNFLFLYSLLFDLFYGFVLLPLLPLYYTISSTLSKEEEEVEQLGGRRSTRIRR